MRSLCFNAANMIFQIINEEYLFKSLDKNISSNLIIL